MSRDSVLNIGFIALGDCAPLIVAKEYGLFEEEGLEVRLNRELGWATIRDKVINGELHAAHALGAMPLATSLGIGGRAVSCQAAALLNREGNGVTLATKLCAEGVNTSEDLKHYMRASGRKECVFAVVFPTSSHAVLLRQWLEQGGLQVDRNVRIVVLPPPQVVRNLEAGTIDGFCVGEPWNTIASQRGAGELVATSGSISPGHPEKVLMMRNDFATRRPEEAAKIVAAVNKACLWCEKEDIRSALPALLSRREYLNCPVEALYPVFRQSSTRDGIGVGIRFGVGDLLVDEIARWFAQGLETLGFLQDHDEVLSAWGKVVYGAAPTGTGRLG